MRTLAATIALSIALSTPGVPADACGDKLLVIGRRVKRVPPAKHPASILLYMPPGSALTTAAKGMNLETTLRQAGHTVETLDQTEGLRGRLESGGYDFVLTDLPDAARVSREAATGKRAPEVVPVTSKAGKTALRDSQQAYPVVIQTGRSLSYLSALDAAMQRREGMATER